VVGHRFRHLHDLLDKRGASPRCSGTAAAVRRRARTRAQAGALRAAVLRVASEPAFRRAAALVGARMRAHRVTPVQRAAGAPQATHGPST